MWRKSKRIWDCSFTSSELSQIHNAALSSKEEVVNDI